VVLLPAAYFMLETGITGRVTTVTAGDEPDAAPVRADDAAFATGQTVV
jgi:hypothetical protein